MMSVARLGGRCYSSLSGAAAGARHVAQSSGARCLLPPQSSSVQTFHRRRRARSALAAGAGSLSGHTEPARLFGAHLRARDARAHRRAFSAVASATVAPPAVPSATPVTHPSVKSRLESVFAEALAKAFPKEYESMKLTPVIAVCGNPEFGDYQCNNAMALFQRLKGAAGGGGETKKKGKGGAAADAAPAEAAAPPPPPTPPAGSTPPPASPRAVAEAILAALPASPLIEATSIAGPGFINVTLSHSWLAAELGTLLHSGAKAWAPPTPGGRRRAVVDFSSPNIAKEMHVGHLRSTILGDTLARLLEFTGAEVLRLNHVGDWGTQFGMLIEHLWDQPGGGSEASVSDLQAFYKAAKKRFDEDAEFKARAQAAVVRLQGGGEKELAAWRAICEVSRKEFEDIYRRLGVTLEERGESFYNPLIPDRLAELREKKISEVSDGAECVFTEGSPNPLIVRKTDGGFNYASTDLAAIWQRVTKERADWIVYVTDIGQAGHFQQVFVAARAAGWVPADGSVRVDHVGFGLVLGEDGKRFRTRSSEVVRLADLLDEAKARCLAQLKERGGREGDSEAELEAAAEAMGYGAVKYADLNQNRTTNYTFNYDRMLDMKGNTAVYLLYAHARINSIIRKAGKSPQEAAKVGPIVLGAKEEQTLALAISRFPEVVEAALDELAPNRLTDYLYDLSSKFNDFYGACQVIGTAEEGSRLQLCEATAVIMRQTFELLGVKPLMRL